MIRLHRYSFLIFIIIGTYGCFGPFKKSPEPEPEPVAEPVKFILPLESYLWERLKPTFSDKNDVQNTIGLPDFIKKHNSGEDWYYLYSRSNNNAIISFPVSGHLINHVQYIKYPEWN